MKLPKFGGLEIIESAMVPRDQPVIEFDPQRKCLWATPQYRAEIDAWLLKRFGREPVIYNLGNALAIHPENAARVRALLHARTKAYPEKGTSRPGKR